MSDQKINKGYCSSVTLIECIRNGDKAAETELITKHQRGLLLMLRRRSGDCGLADDVAQTTWELVLQKIRNGAPENPEKLSAFIIAIAKNQLLMAQRGKTRTQTGSEDFLLTIPDDERTPEQQINQQHLQKSVHSVLNEMQTERDRIILRRFYINEDSKESICDDYELTDQHFNRVLFRARQRFKQLWESREHV